MREQQLHDLLARPHIGLRNSQLLELVVVGAHQRLRIVGDRIENAFDRPPVGRGVEIADDFVADAPVLDALARTSRLRTGLVVEDRYVTHAALLAIPPEFPAARYPSSACRSRARYSARRRSIA